MKVKLQNILETPFEDQMLIRNWRNDSRIAIYFSIPYIDEETHKNWLKKQKQENAPIKVFLCTVSGIKSGACYIRDIDYANKTAEFGGFMNPDNMENHKGLGFITWLFLFKYAFEELGLYKLNAKVLGNNEMVLSIHKKLNGHKEGVFKEQILKNGKRQDVYIFSYFASEWPEISKKYEKLYNKYIEI